MKKYLIVIAAIVLLVGIILACSTTMVSTTIYDVIENTVPVGIGKHLVVVMLFVTVSNLLLLNASKKIKLAWQRLVFHLAFEVSGLFFALATAYEERGSVLLNYYKSMSNAPDFYSGDVTGEAWFPSLLSYSDRFYDKGTTFWILTFIGLAIFIAVTIVAFKKPTVTNDQQTT